MGIHMLESESNFYLSIAQISLALAGFTGVVVGLNRAEAGSMTAQDRIGLIHIMLSSGAALVFSLLPFAIESLGFGIGTTQRVTETLLGTVALAASLYWAKASKSVKPRHPVPFWILLALGILIGAALLTTAIGAIDRLNFVPIALLWLLVVGFAQFFGFLVTLWAGDVK